MGVLCRLVCVAAVLALLLLLLSTLLTLLARCTTPAHLYMAASATFTLAGLALASALVMLVSAVSDEFHSTNVTTVICWIFTGFHYTS